MSVDISCPVHPRYSAQRPPKLLRGVSRCCCYELWLMVSEVRTWHSYALRFFTKTKRHYETGGRI